VGEHLVGKYNLDTTPVAQGDVPTYSEELFVPPPDPVFEVDNPGPGPVPGAPKSIVVSISQQRMWAYEGDVAVLSTFVSTGKPGFDTPTGLFTVIVKKEIEDMEGLIGGEYYNVPDVPDVMYFTNVGHAIHGTYWHNNFGAVMSHGCVNLPLDVAAFLYDWTPMGTPVLVVP
jgi:lipoprotein-anchoring transpeptidase ErfK/SrfK